MSERNNSSFFDYEFTSSTEGATEFHDGDRLDTQNPYRTPGMVSQKIGHEVALADAARVRPERLPTPNEQKAMRVESLATMVNENLRAKRLAKELAQQGYTQNNVDLAAGE